jgi:hypothetical protein
MPTEIAPQTATAGSEGSAPSNVTTDPNVAPAVDPGSAPGSDQSDGQPAVDGTVGATAATPEPPAESKAVQELKTQRLKRQQAEREAAYWQGVAQGSTGAGVTRPDSHPRTDPSAPASPPKLVDYPTYEEYEAARDSFIIQRAKAEVVQELRTTDAKTRDQSVNEAFMARVQAASVADPELPSILEDMSLPISDAMATAVKESELAPQLLRYLNDNRDVARKLHGMSPISAAREIGKIETQLAARTKTAPPRQVSQAPEPITTVTTSGGALDIDPERESISDFMRRRNAGR